MMGNQVVKKIICGALPFALILIFLNSPVKSQTQCFKSNNAFQVGEKLNFNVYYNMGFIWVEAGMAYFNIDRINYQGTNAYCFDSYGTSLPKHDWFFKVRSKYLTYLDSATLRPMKYQRRSLEGSNYAEEDYLFDYSKKKAFLFTSNTKRKFKKDTVALNDCTFDVLSSIYYFRNVDFSKCKPNEKLPVSMIIDNAKYDLYIRYMGKEIVENKNGDKYRCIKFKALLVAGTIFNGGEDLEVYVTDDQNKIPILINAKILVGSIKVYFAGATGLKHPLDSKIKP